MASVEIRVPDNLWDDRDKTGSIVLWLYKEGAVVKEGDVIAEMLFEKATLELPAPASGKLHIAVEAEVPVALGDLIGSIET